MPIRSPIHKPAHSRSRVDQERLRRQRLDQVRPGAKARGYDVEWRKLRAAFLRAYPDCMVVGCSRPATDCDHILSLRDYPQLRLEWGNLRALCHQHHSRRTALDQGFARSSSSTR